MFYYFYYINIDSRLHAQIIPSFNMNDFKLSVINPDYSTSSVILPGASLGGKPEYTSSWFATNNNSKPPLTVPPAPAVKEEWAKMLGHALTAGSTPSVAVRYMFEYITEKIKVVNLTQWTSYGVSIAEPGTTITPLALLSMTKGTTAISGTQGESIDVAGRHRLFYILIAGYRFGIASEILQGDYKSVVLGKINQVLKNDP